MKSSVLDATAQVTKLDTGIQKAENAASNLENCLADSFMLMIKSQVYHWNVVGPLFQPLHVLTQEHYENLFEAIDDIAERIRALGYPAPSSIVDMAQKSVIDEDTGSTSAEEMVRTLIKDHEAVASRFRDAAKLADHTGDLVTADLLTERIAFHEKAVWMLKAIITN